MTIKACLQQAVSMLYNEELDSDTVRLDTELLLSHALQQTRTYLYTWPERQISPEEKQTFDQHLRRRLGGEPIAYILGAKEFWSLSFEVNSSTLIPRPETELLIETALELLDKKNHYEILDLGTGTGAIGLSLGHECPNWSVTAVDKFTEAVELARSNRDRLNIKNVKVMQSNWFDQLFSQNPTNSALKPFDLIVSNPPYIDPTDPHLDQGDIRFEPRSALISEKNGLADILRIIEQAPLFLSKNGWLLLEHGYDQKNAVQDIFRNNGYTKIQTRLDLGERPRATFGLAPE